MFTKPKRLFGTLAVLAIVLLALTLLGGSSGTVEGGVDTMQQIANVTMPLFALTVLVTIVLAVIYLVRGRKS